jgi:hypothetical protein
VEKIIALNVMNREVEIKMTTVRTEGRWVRVRIAGNEHVKHAS